MPFSKNGGGVSTGLEQLGNERFPGIDALRTGVIQRAEESDAIGVTARHQRRPRRGADRLRHIKAGELHAFLRHPVEIRCLKAFRSETADIRVAQIIRNDDDEVGCRGNRTGRPDPAVDRQ